MKDDLIKQLTIANNNYRIGTPIMSDEEYDKLVDNLKENGLYPFEDKVEPEPLYKNHIKHKNPLLSTQKAKEDEEMDKWFMAIEKTANILGIHLIDVFIRATQKLDGIASVWYDHKLATRGSGIEGNDISINIERGLVMPKHSSIEPTLGELIINKEYFERELSSEFSNSRNFVSGTIMSDTLNSYSTKAFEDKMIVMRAYNELPSSTSNLLYTKNNLREIEDLVSNFGEYDIDGVVFEVMNKDIKKEMGRNDHHNHWQIALKPKDPVYVSEVISINWETGRTGKVTPVINIKPIDIDGVTVKRCTGHNAKLVVENELEPGVKIEIIRSGSVIPTFVRRIK